MDHYEVLGIPQDASPSEVRQAYKARLLIAHPDKAAVPAVPAEAAVSPAAAMPTLPSGGSIARIQDAYAVLKNPELRAVYDESLRSKRVFENALEVYETVTLADMEPSADGSQLTHPCRCGDLSTCI
jgi:curved DNA-binding protein CbpA